MSEPLRQSLRGMLILALAVVTASCNGTGSSSPGGGGNSSPASIASLICAELGELHGGPDCDAAPYPVDAAGHN